MTIERDEADETDWVGEVDPIALAICPLLTFVIEATASGSPERAWAMGEVLAGAGEACARANAPVELIWNDDRTQHSDDRHREP